MRTCRLKPDYTTCAKCLDYQIQNSVIALCEQCKNVTKEYELLLMVPESKGGYSILMDEYGAKRIVSNTEIIFDSNKKFREEC